jgi:hypothetical protein
MLSAAGALLKAGQQQANGLLPALQAAARQYSIKQPITGMQTSSIWLAAYDGIQTGGQQTGYHARACRVPAQSARTCSQ